MLYGSAIRNDGVCPRLFLWFLRETPPVTLPEIQPDRWSQLGLQATLRNSTRTEIKASIGKNVQGVIPLQPLKTRFVMDTTSPNGSRQHVRVQRHRPLPVHIDKRYRLVNSPPSGLTVCWKKHSEANLNLQFQHVSQLKMTEGRVSQRADKSPDFQPGNF